MVKKVLLIIFLIILFLNTVLMNGCWDRRELEGLGLVQALGLDAGPGGQDLTITTMIAIPPKLGVAAASPAVAALKPEFLRSP